jgi:hypothetical protein
VWPYYAETTAAKAPAYDNPKNITIRLGLIHFPELVNIVEPSVAW